MLLNRKDSAVLLIDVQEKLTPAVLNCEALIQRCEWVLKLAQHLQVPILASEQYPQGLGSTIKQLKPFYPAENCVSKVHFSCAQSPEFQKHVNKLNKNQLLLIGIEAHVCILQSALELREAGFEIYVVVDAVSSRNPLDLQYGLKRMKQAGVHLVTSEMIFFEWLKQAGTEEFKALRGYIEART